MATFLAVKRYGSVSGAARELLVTPSQVSKAVERLSEELKKPLLARTGRGVVLTEDGERLAPSMQGILSKVSEMRGEEETEPELTVAAPSYLVSHFLSVIAVALPKVRVRGLQLTPVQIRAYAPERLFAVSLTIGSAKLPSSWASESVGELRKGLFANPRLAGDLGPFPVAVSRLKTVPFVSPIALANGQTLPADDDCPLGRSERRLGHEAQSISLALDLAAHTDQLAFGPVIAARSYLERGLLVEVPVIGWNSADSLHVASHADHVLARVHKTIVRAVASALDGVASTPRPKGAPRCADASVARAKRR